MATTELTRTFVFGNRELADPSNELSPEEVLMHYSKIHKKLIGGKVQPPKLVGESMQYELTPVYGDKG